MLELVILACLISHPDKCETFAIARIDPEQQFQCSVGAQQIIAEWSGNNPKYKITSWTCLPTGTIGKDI